MKSRFGDMKVPGSSIYRLLRDTPGAFRNRVRMHGFLGTAKVVPDMVRCAVRHYLSEASYSDLIQVHRWTDRRRDALSNRLAGAGAGLPRISVVMAVDPRSLKRAERTVRSLVQQVYVNWDLTVVTPAEPQSSSGSMLRRWHASDKRIRAIVVQDDTRIPQGVHEAAEAATGECVVLLEKHGAFSPDALGEIALALAEHPEADVLYADEDSLGQSDRRVDPRFKGRYAPELLLSEPYFGPMLVVRKTTWKQIGGIRPDYQGAWHYDLTLRASEEARQVRHLPLVLYHVFATNEGQASRRSDLTLKASAEAFGRRGVQVQLKESSATEVSAGWEFPDEGPEVTIIIPTRNRLELLRRCIESLKKTTYRNYRILVIDNESDDPATLAYLASIEGEVVRLASPGGKFSFAYLNNRAVEHARDPYVLLLNNDTEVLEPRWLSRMMGYARLPGVGSVGARLLYPDMRVQHAGIVHSGMDEQLPYHLFKFLAPTDPGYMSWSLTTRNVAAVTAACMVTPRELYLRLGGLDEANFAVSFNDVDYGYRLIDAGYRNVYCAGAVLKHYESISRGVGDAPPEREAIRAKYGQWMDPYLSPHLLADETVRLRPMRG